MNQQLMQGKDVRESRTEVKTHEEENRGDAISTERGEG